MIPTREEALTQNANRVTASLRGGDARGGICDSDDVATGTAAAPPWSSKSVVAWGMWNAGAAAYHAVILTFVFSVYLTSAVGRDLYLPPSSRIVMTTQRKVKISPKWRIEQRESATHGR